MKNLKVQKIEEIINLMIEYHQNTKDFKKIKKNIDSFSIFAYDFYQKSLNSKNEEEYLEFVNDFVIKLNKLNKKVDYTLIETVEREEIYSFIVYVSNKLGYSFDYDITEQYRDW